MTASTTTLNPGTGGEKILNDILANVDAAAAPAGSVAQVVKMAYGAQGDAYMVSPGQPMPVLDAVQAQAVRQKNSAGTVGDFGYLILAQRRDSDTPETTADGQYTALKQDQAGRLKVATQPGDVVATSGSITANAQTVAIATSRISNVSISLVGTSLVGHNAIFEISNDSTNGTDGNWKTVQAVRTDSNVVETSTGVLTATPAYAWELNVASYAYFRVRATAHTSGTAAYTFKPGAYATEPVPAGQNGDAVPYTYNVTGVVAINTDVMVIDCSRFRTISLHCTSMGTAGVITPQWSNDPALSGRSAAGLITSAGAAAATFNAAGLWTVQVVARYLVLRLTTATTAGTTTILAQAFQQPGGPLPVQPVTLAANTPTLAAGANLVGDVGIQYRANATGGAGLVSVLSPATPAVATIKATAGRLIGWQLHNGSAAVRSVKLFNVAAPTLGTTGAVFEIDIPAGGRAELNFPGGVGFATAITYSVTSAKGLLDNTATGLAANDVSGAFFFA